MNLLRSRFRQYDVSHNSLDEDMRMLMKRAVKILLENA